MLKPFFWFSISTFLLLGALGACKTEEEISGTPDAPTGPTIDAPTGPTSDAPPTGPASGWRKLDLPLDNPSDTRVTAIHCTTVDKCVVGTETFGEGGIIYAATSQGVGAELVHGDDALETAGVIGHLGFLGFDENRGSLIARLSASGAVASATGDFTHAASWSIVSIGRDEGEHFALNAQEALRSDAADHWLLVNHVGFVYGASSAPGAETGWTKLWSPTATPSVPADFEDRFQDDPTLCDSDVTTTEVPTGTQNVYLSEDLGTAIFPAGGLNQLGSASPGVCISTDRGVTFFNVPFTGLNEDVDPPGPLAVTCLDGDKCFAFGGLFAQPDSAYVYYTDDASAGKGSTWHRATLPAAFAGADEVLPQYLFFAPDGIHGWLAGSNNAHAMLLRSTDAGHTWTDVSARVQAVANEKLHVGFAVDANHIFVGGLNGTLLFDDRANQ